MSSIFISIPIVQNHLVRYVPLAILVTGTIGNILNCLIFTRRSLRQNSCSIYFLASSIANFFAIYFGCLTRLLGTFGIAPSASQMGLYCRSRTFLTYIGLAGSTWFIVGACADRYASSSSNVRIRSFSQVQVARRVVCLLSATVFLVYFEMNFCFDGTTQGANCYPSTLFCRMYNDFNLLVTFSLFPPIGMLVLGLLTIRNVRASRRLRKDTNVKDRQLTSMLLIQVLCLVILSLPVSVQKIYSEMTYDQWKSAEHKLIENFIATLVVLLAMINSSTSFYLFTLTGKVFRKELKNLFLSRRCQANVEQARTATVHTIARNHTVDTRQ